MKLRRLWNVTTILTAVGLTAVVLAMSACAATPASPATVTATVTTPASPATVTATATVSTTITPPAPKVAQTLTVDANTVISADGAPSPQDICVISSRFQQGESVVWRIKVYDPSNGQAMDDKTLDSVVVNLKDGQNFTAAYGGHPGGPGATPTDNFWSVAWKILPTYPTGSVGYQITAKSKDGRTGTYSQFNVAPSLLTIVAAQPPTASTLIIDTDTVAGAPSQGVAPNVAGVCVVTSQYKPTNSIVWRIKVFDPVTGKPMDDKTLKSVQVKLPDGQVFQGQYGGHPGNPGAQATDYFWSAAWTIPANYPTGSLQYQINAQSTDGRSGSYNQFNVAPSLLTIVK